ncbi:MAG: SHOCT domain-containing protein [Oscillospiraceae bacterium]|nr:SHOCT domain-containing protein [Oscillospiraceae bacterium]
MAFFDKLKDAANAAKEKAQATIESAKAAQAQKKAEQEAYNAEMEEKAMRKAQKLKDAIVSSFSGQAFLSSISDEALLAFTKDFYDKILMPANSVSRSKITMHPYITGKKFAKFCDSIGCYDVADKPLIHLVIDKKKEFLVTDHSLYFSVALDEDPKFIARGNVPCDQISSLAVEKGEGTFVLKCNGCVLVTLNADKTTTEDCLTLRNYFDCIVNSDFTITDQEVDKLIREKIGEKVYSEVKKYMVYEDELLVYFAWGLDSLSAKDYFVCTNKQVIMVNREMGGATANIKQFYYEDITSASVLQNSNSSSLTGYLLETALTAAMQTCDLVLTVAGAATRINTLYKVEAERVVAVYHQYRKAAKAQGGTPPVIVQQSTPQADPMEQLEKLAKLRAAGIISEEEFDRKKADILAKI